MSETEVELSFETLEVSGIALENPCLQESMSTFWVIYRVAGDDSLREKTNIEALASALNADHGSMTVSLVRGWAGGQVALLAPSRDNALESAARYIAYMDQGHHLDSERYYDKLQELSQAEWMLMTPADRIKLLQSNAIEPVSLGLSDNLPKEAIPALEQRFE